MKKIKHFSIGLLSGAILATGISVFADDGLEKIEAYLRPSLPITLDGKKISLENPPVMYDGSTYLKLRDVAAITGMGVSWNEETQTVELSSAHLNPGNGSSSGSTSNSPSPSAGPITNESGSSEISETTIDGMGSIVTNNVTYVSVSAFQNKYLKPGDLQLDPDKRTIVINYNNKKITISLSDIKNYIVYKDTSYFNYSLIN